MFKAQISSIQGLGIPFNTKEEGFNRVLFSFAQGIQVSVVWTPKLSTAKYAQSDVHAKHLNMISTYIYIYIYIYIYLFEKNKSTIILPSSDLD
jgi:hypothetical protein